MVGRRCKEDPPLNGEKTPPRLQSRPPQDQSCSSTVESRDRDGAPRGTEDVDAVADADADADAVVCCCCVSAAAAKGGIVIPPKASGPLDRCALLAETPVWRQENEHVVELRR